MPMNRTSESLNLRDDAKPFAAHFKDLDVYKKSFDIALEIHAITQNFPKTEQYGGLADQMRRASKGICGNIAEGFAKQQASKAEFRRYLMIAIGSAHEMVSWIDFCIALNYINQQQANELSDVYDHIVRMLQSLYSKC